MSSRFAATPLCPTVILMSPFHSRQSVSPLVNILILILIPYLTSAAYASLRESPTLPSLRHNEKELLSPSSLELYGDDTDSIRVSMDRRTQPEVSVSVVEVVNPRNRSKRSHQHIIESITNRHIILGTSINLMKQVYLEVLNDGRVRCSTTFQRSEKGKRKKKLVARESVQMDILVFLPRNSTLSVQEALEDVKLNNSEVLIGRYKTKMYLAMNERGETITERMENSTVTSNAVWKMIVSPFGITFHHAYYPNQLDSNKASRNKRWYLGISEETNERLLNGKEEATHIYWNVGLKLTGNRSRMRTKVTNPLYVGRDPLRRVMPASRDNLDNLVKGMRFVLCEKIKLGMERLIYSQLRDSMSTLNEFRVSISYLQNRLGRSPYNWSVEKRNRLASHFEEWIRLLSIKKFNNMKRKLIVKEMYSKIHLLNNLFNERYLTAWRGIRAKIDRVVGNIFLLLLPVLELAPSEKLEFITNSNLHYLLRSKLHMRMPSIRAIQRASFYHNMYLGTSKKSVPSHRHLKYLIPKKFSEMKLFNLLRNNTQKGSLYSIKHLNLCNSSINSATSK